MTTNNYDWRLLRDNVIVLDLETARSPDDCRYCGHAFEAHRDNGVCQAWAGRRPSDDITQFASIGWHDKPALGLSIGCYWDAHDGRIHWFDEDTLEATMLQWVKEQPLLVGFNTISFDFSLMRGILRRRAETLPQGEQFVLEQLCDDFKALCTASYDILAEIWQVDPASKMVKGLNSLDSIAQANGLGAKSGHGAQAPRDWAAGRWATVLNYCAQDVYLAKGLFDLVCAGTPLQRAGGRAVRLPIPGEQKP